VVREGTMVVSATLAESIADKLRYAIRSGVYLSGERLVELTLAQRLDVSQNTIRDALRLLEAEGWVVKHARHGVYVRSFTLEEAAELYALWAALERLALGWAMEIMTKKDLTQLRRLIQDARKLALTEDLQSAIETVFHFHTLILELSGKTQTAELVSGLHNRIYLLEVIRQTRAAQFAQPRSAPAALRKVSDDDGNGRGSRFAGFAGLSDCAGSRYAAGTPEGRGLK
jgi:DNA-binding GntR family transcriptional regulator